MVLGTALARGLVTVDMSFSRLSVSRKVGLGVAAAAAVAGAVWVYRRTVGASQDASGARDEADDIAFVKAEKADAAARAGAASSSDQPAHVVVRGMRARRGVPGAPRQHAVTYCRT